MGYAVKGSDFCRKHKTGARKGPTWQQRAEKHLKMYRRAVETAEMHRQTRERIAARTWLAANPDAVDAALRAGLGHDDPLVLRRVAEALEAGGVNYARDVLDAHSALPGAK